MVRHDAVHLFGERVAPVPRAQPCLHVSHADLPVLGRQRGHHHGRGVALHQDPVRPLRDQDRVEVGEDARGQPRQGLPGLHEVQIDVWRQVEQGEHLVEHLAVLRGGAGADRKLVRPGLERADHRRHLDRLGPRAEDGQHPQWPACVSPPIQFHPRINQAPSSFFLFPSSFIWARSPRSAASAPRAHCRGAAQP